MDRRAQPQGLEALPRLVGSSHGDHRIALSVDEQRGHRHDQPEGGRVQGLADAGGKESAALGRIGCADRGEGRGQAEVAYLQREALLAVQTPQVFRWDIFREAHAWAAENNARYTDDGIAPGTRWEDIPEDWECPDCGISKADFDPYEE